MSYDCDGCAWTSGPDSDGPSMPRYNFTETDGQRVQVAHCPECMTILGTRENDARPLGGRK